MLTGDYAGRVSLQCSKLSGENSPDNRPQLHQVCSVSVDQRPSSEGQMIRAVTCWRLLLDEVVEFELLLTQLRGNWLLGSGPQPVERTPLPSTQVRP